MIYPDLSASILDGVFAVHRSLGPGLLEQCYHNALFYEFRRQGLTVIYNAPFTVRYRDQVVGEYLADLVIADSVIVEVKSAGRLGNEHTAQLLNYLHISGYRLGFLVNFHPPRVEFKRLVL